jgi:hypothetical protein
MVQVSRFIDSDILIEIEAEVVAECDQQPCDQRNLEQIKFRLVLVWPNVAFPVPPGEETLANFHWCRNLGNNERIIAMLKVDLCWIVLDPMPSSLWR